MMLQYAKKELVFLKQYLKVIKNFLQIVICGGLEDVENKGTEPDYAFPCGICQQVLREFTKAKEFKVYVCTTKEKYNCFTLEELFPHSFGPEHLLEQICYVIIIFLN